jgi:hypothetical protein
MTWPHGFLNWRVWLVSETSFPKRRQIAVGYSREHRAMRQTLPERSR